jgi:transposase
MSHPGGRERAPSKDLASAIQASSRGLTLHSYRIASLPIINHVLERMRLEPFLKQYLPSTGRESKIPTARGLLVLLRNLLLAREPLYGIGEWAAPCAPDLLGLSSDQMLALNDDRVGRCLDRLFDADRCSLILSVVTHVIREFAVSLDELHNDSTTVSFYGKYENARPGRRRRGQLTLGILFGHSKAHRPDLKQLLFILTVAADGAVPVHFTATDGNTTDDTTHPRTWDLLCELTGRPDFLYVADSKLATTDNMAYIHRRKGRFISVLPRTRKEDKKFRERVQHNPSSISWKEVHQGVDEDGEVLDSFRIADQPALSAEGYRLLWFHSSRKQDLDQSARAARLERCLQELAAFRRRLQSPRTRFRDRVKVGEKIEGILNESSAFGLIQVEIKRDDQESFRQQGPGRPGPKTPYVRHTRSRFDLAYRIETDAVAAESLTDGIFPLVTNDSTLTGKKVLLAYKRQPLIEKRFKQVKTDYEVAPVYLKDVARIEALLTVYFLAMLVQSLIEREVRRAMSREGLDTLPLYPEGRSCKAPCVRRILDVFENVQRHELTKRGETQPTILKTELSHIQERLLGMLNIPMTPYRSG